MLMATVGMVWNVTTRVLRQRHVPQQRLGRVSTSMRLISLCATSIGGAAAGIVAETAGVRAVGLITTLAATVALTIILGAPLDHLGQPQQRHSADANPTAQHRSPDKAPDAHANQAQLRGTVTAHRPETAGRGNPPSSQ